jgi:hypothetical protein
MVAKNKFMVRTVQQKGVIIYIWPFETIRLFEICKKEEIRPTKVRKLYMS